MSQPDELSQPTGEWECVECGHIEPGLETLRPKQCPDCGAPAKALEFFPWDDDRSAWDLWRDEEALEENEENGE